MGFRSSYEYFLSGFAMSVTARGTLSTNDVIM
jgi:hypothetical protein